jgi:DNA-binding CsgD family transcriptional regulator
LDPLLRDLFGLSTAERAAALAVIRTGSVDNAAASLSVSRETIRSQLKAVFRKCDIRSTLQLAALIRSVGLFCGAERTWNERRAPSRSPNDDSVEPRA